MVTLKSGTSTAEVYLFGGVVTSFTDLDEICSTSDQMRSLINRNQSPAESRTAGRNSAREISKCTDSPETWIGRWYRVERIR